jgi:uncharacterized protein (TIGR00645 family)
MWRPTARGIQEVIFFSRWLLAPFLVGLFCCVLLIIFRFFAELFALVVQLPGITWHDLVVGVLTLVDLTLVTNLIMVIIFAAYENYFRQLGPASRTDWPEDLKRLDFGDLKQKLLGSIAAIAAVDALAWFLDLDKYSDTSKLGWAIAFPLMFVIAMVLLGIADWFTRLSNKSLE